MQGILSRTGYDPALVAENGNRFLIGNGYLGIRGTMCEAGPEQLAAVNLSGIYHRKSGQWQEPLNAMNPFYAKIRGYSLPERADQLLHHEMSVDISCGLFHRKSVFQAGDGILVLEQERFCSMEDVHLSGQRLIISSDRELTVQLVCGIDRRVWDLNGPHYDHFTQQETGTRMALCGETDDRQQVAVAIRLSKTGEALPDGLRLVEISLKPNVPVTVDLVASVYTTRDCPDPTEAALDSLLPGTDYEQLRERSAIRWKDLWNRARVEIEGDREAEFAINYSIYQLLSAAPRHSDHLSVPLRGVSGQTTKGAILWYTEMYMLDFYLSALPGVARSALQYRIDTLPAAMEKAKRLGFSGAFYPWESVEDGQDACGEYNISDVFTGRTLRCWFHDKEYHISSAIVYGLRKYLAHTGDNSLMRGGGARVILECARFYMSVMTQRLNSQVVEITDVIGPDEYHERVSNSFYTNEMARMVLRYAAQICPVYLPGLDPKEIAAFRDAADRLKLQKPDPETRVIPEFDGYMELEDISVQEMNARLLHPKEYKGGAYGVAAGTQVLKQADVVAYLTLCHAFTGVPADILAANYDYYEPRTEHGSTRSSCLYALCACMAGRPDEAYRRFLDSAETDMNGNHTQWEGYKYIDGTHLAAAAGAWLVLLYGFMGLRFEWGIPTVHPNLPKGWKHVRMKLMYRGRQYELEA